MKTAFMTASYAGDFDRCRLLCESMDRLVDGDWHHYLMVERRDVALFSSLQGTRRTVVSEADLFPFWLRAMPDPTNFGRRRLWVSPFSLPLRGWHAQQIRRLAMARHVDADMLLSLDSDVVIVRRFDPASLWKNGDMTFFRIDGGVTPAMTDHRSWLAHAGRLNGLPEQVEPAQDYINPFVAWRTDTARALLDHIETVSGHHWVRAVVASRAISECSIYGRFTDEVLGGRGHQPSPASLCHLLWFRETYPETREGLQAFMADLAPWQIAVGIQSFINHPISEIRRLTSAVTPS